MRDRQDIIRLLAEAAYKAMEAESAQRGFLLTGEEKYLHAAGCEPGRGGSIAR